MDCALHCYFCTCHHQEQASGKDPDAVKSTKTITAHCGRDTLDAVHGSIVSWAPFPIKLIQQYVMYPPTHHHHISLQQTTQVACDTRSAERSNFIPFLYSMNRRSDKELLELLSGPFNITNDSPDELKKQPLESITELMFTSTIGFMRKYGHNTFVALDRHNQSNWGPLTFVDNDRAAWHHPSSESPTENIVQCKSKVRELCKFPRSIAWRFLVLGRNHTVPDSQPISLGKLLLETTGAYGDHGILRETGRLFSAREANVIDQNVQYWYETITYCIAKHGEDSVLIDEPWLKTYDPWQNIARLARSGGENNFAPNLEPEVGDGWADIRIASRKLASTTYCSTTK
jgi:hypothetical protein